MTTVEARRRQRAVLFASQKGLCYWCKQPMALILKHVRDLPKGFKRATLDHLDDRLSGERGKHEGEFRRVMACDECNQQRAREAELRVGIDELRRRSSRYPNDARG